MTRPEVEVVVALTMLAGTIFGHFLGITTVLGAVVYVLFALGSWAREWARQR